MKENRKRKSNHQILWRCFSKFKRRIRFEKLCCELSERNDSEPSSKLSPQGQHNGKNLWKKNKAGITVIRNRKKFEWCPRHNNHVTHKPSTCYLNPSHPQCEEKKKHREEWIATLESSKFSNSKPKIEMNMMNGEECAPANP